MAEEIIQDTAEDSAEEQTELQEAEESVQSKTSKADGEPASTKGPSLNWWDTEGLEPEMQKRIKDIQAEFTRKSQDAARLREEVDRAKDAQNKMTELENAVRLAFENPAVYKQYRDQYYQAKGMQAPPENAQTAPVSFESPEDLIKYMEQREKALITQIESKIHAGFQPFVRDRWTMASDALKAKYPDVYDRYSTKVLTAVASGQYAGLTRTMDEKQVLESVFRAMAFDDLQNLARQQALESVKAKKQATTEKPRKSAVTKSKDPSKEEIIAELRDSGFSFET